MSCHESLRLNATDQPLAFHGEFETLDGYFNYLLHLRAYEEILPFVRGRQVLDLGCNNGYGTDHIREACADIVGVDVSPSAVEDGRARFADKGLRLEVYDGHTLPFADSSFDVVVSLQVIEHIDVALVPEYLGEAVRVLRTGGIAVFTTPNGLVRVAPGERPWNEFHVREFSPDQLRDELAGSFASVEMRGLFGSAAVQQRILSTYRAYQEAGRSARWRSTLRRRLPWLVPLVRRARGGRKTRLPPEQMSQYSTRDFHYTTEGLASALDLLAICRK